MFQLNHAQVAPWLFNGREFLLRAKMSVDINGWSIAWDEGDHRCGWLVWKGNEEEFFFADDQFAAAANLFLEKACGLKPEEPASYKYFFLQDPPSPGTYPNGAIECQAFRPTQRHPVTLQRVHGWVTYPQRLPFYKIMQFGLLSDDLLERTVVEMYRFFGSGQNWYNTVIGATNLFEIKTYREILANEGQSRMAAAVGELIKQGYTMADIEAFEELAQ